MQTYITDLSLLAKLMKSENIPVLSFDSETQQTDGCINITENIHLSIHDDGTFSVGEFIDPSYFFTQCKTLDKAFKTIKKLLK